MTFSGSGIERIKEFRSIADRVARSHGLELFDLQYRRESIGLVLRIIIDRAVQPTEDGNGENLALVLLDEMADINPDMVSDIYNDQTDLMDDMFQEAFSNVSEDDAHMLADVISMENASVGMTEMMFDNLADVDVDQGVMNDIFYDIA